MGVEIDKCMRISYVGTSWATGFACVAVCSCVACIALFAFATGCGHTFTDVGDTGVTGVASASVVARTSCFAFVAIAAEHRCECYASDVGDTGVTGVASASVVTGVTGVALASEYSVMSFGLEASNG